MPRKRTRPMPRKRAVVSLRPAIPSTSTIDVELDMIQRTADLYNDAITRLVNRYEHLEDLPDSQDFNSLREIKKVLLSVKKTCLDGVIMAVRHRVPELVERAQKRRAKK